MSTVAEEFNERLEAFVEKYGLTHASELLKKLTAVSYTHLTLPTIYSV